MDKLLFQYCPKLAVVRDGSVLLCRRDGEADLDGVFTFIGGKMEHGDASITDALQREKNEEVGVEVALSTLTSYSVNAEFTKADGSRMILPHYLADYVDGEIKLGAEYSEYRWVKLDALTDFSPMVPNVPGALSRLLRLREIAQPDDFTLI